MKRIKLLLSAITVLGLSISLHAQSMYVVESGAETPHTLSDIRKLTFSSGNLNVVPNSGTTSSYALSGVDKVTFQAGTTGGGGGEIVCSNTEPLRFWPDTTPFTNQTADGITLTSTSSGLWGTQALVSYNFEGGRQYSITFNASTPDARDIVVMIRSEYAGVSGLEESRTTTSSLGKITFEFTYPDGPDSINGELLLAVGGGSAITISDLCINNDEATFSAPVLEANKGFLIYPNPANSQFTVNTQDAGQLQVISINGKVLMNQNVNAGQTNINISNLSAGMYICRYSNGKTTKVTKLVKQ